MGWRFLYHSEMIMVRGAFEHMTVRQHLDTLVALPRLYSIAPSLWLDFIDFNFEVLRHRREEFLNVCSVF